jgi:hypothetical protein
MKPYVKIALFTVFLIALGSVFAALSLYFKKHKDLSTTRADYVLTATDLQKEFENNEQTASEKYVNKIIEVTGMVTSVNLDDSSNINISLKTGSDLSSVICTFASSDTTEFKKGEEITLRGDCSGFLMDVLLNNCAIIRENGKTRKNTDAQKPDGGTTS